MTPPWAAAGVLAVGIVVAIGTFVYSRYRKHRNYENHNYRRPSSPSYQGQHNLTCPICGRRLSANFYEMPCGHRFHRGCYADRLLDNRDTHGNPNVTCPICGDSGERSENETRADEGLSDRRGKCSICDMPIQSSAGDVKRLDCGHLIHPPCSSLSSFIRCGNCRRADGEL